MPDRDTTKRMFTHMINMMEKHDTMTISCGDPLMELLKDVRELLKEQEDMGKELTDAMELIHKKNERIEKLLKEQEAVEPIISESYRTNSGRMSRRKAWCGACGIGINFDAKFCDHCGKAVKWE